MESSGNVTFSDVAQLCSTSPADDARPNFIKWLFVAIAVIGIAGNTFSIVLLAKKRRGRAKILSDFYRVYVIALAVADNGMLFFTGLLRYVVIAWFYDPMSTKWYENHVCRWHRFFMHTSHNASVWLLVVMALDRLVAVCFPFVYREIKQHPQRAKKVTGVVVIMSFVLATPFLAVGPLHKTIRIETARHFLEVVKGSALKCGPGSVLSNISSTFVSPYDCLQPDRESVEAFLQQNVDFVFNSSRTGENATIRVVVGCSLAAYMSEEVAFIINIIFHIVLAFLLPYVVLIVLNVAIFWKLNCSNLQRTSSSGEGRQRLNRRITIMMLVVCGTFIILWLPQVFTLLTHVDAHAHNCDNDQYVSYLAAFCGISNSALNFALYCLTVAKFRRAAARSLHLNWLFRKSDSRALSQYSGENRNLQALVNHASEKSNQNSKTKILVKRDLSMLAIKTK